MSEQKQIQLPPPRGSDEILKGFYANNLSAAWTKEEFILDFMNIFPPQPIVGSRIIISPGHLKRINSYLNGIIKQYESQHNQIQEAEKPSEIGFKTQ